MHQGGHSFGLRQLIQHLHTYYITTIHALAHDLKGNPNWKIADAFEHKSRLYVHFLYRLRHYDDNPLCADSLLLPVLILQNRFEKPAWQITKEFE